MLFRIRAVIVDEVNIITCQEKKRKRKGKPPSDQYKLFIEKLRGLISLAVKDRYRRERQ